MRDLLHKDPDFGANPFENTYHFFEDSGLQSPKKPVGLFDYFRAFFTPVAKALGSLQDRITVELFLGEMSDTMERLRYGICDQRISLEQHLKAKEPRYPTAFHRVHMSNNP